MRRLYPAAGLNTAVAVGRTPYLSSSCASLSFRRPLLASKRTFFDNPFKRSTPKVTLNDTLYDKQHSRYTGVMFGVKTDDWVFYGKLGAVGLGVFGALYFVAKGYSWLTHFSMAAIARFGFMSGFATCALLYSSALLIQRKMYINANAVYPVTSSAQDDSISELLRFL